MIKALTAIALAVVALGASAHPFPTTHYHDNNGRVVIGNQFFPQVTTSYERDRYGRRVRVETTVRCIRVDRSPRNNHLVCREERRKINRFIDRGFDHRHYRDRDF
ncbi:hypothetical protein [Acinetobacter sp.]|uniref:hypothetical protein n=1 Tax=Acinetobacter sp. TaxID=472 RepID=UPI00388F41D8